MINQNPLRAAIVLFALLGMLGTATSLAASRGSAPAGWSPTWPAQVDATPRGTLPLPLTPRATPTLTPSPTATGAGLGPTATITLAPPSNTTPGPATAQTPASLLTPGSAVDTDLTAAPGKLIAAGTGGTLQSADGAIVIDVPAGALKEDFQATVRYRSLSEAQRSQAQRANLKITNIVADLTVRTAAGQDLARGALEKSLQLTIRYDKSQVAGIKGDSLAVFTWDATSQQWQQEGGCQKDGATNALSCNIENPGTFAVAGTPENEVTSSSGSSTGTNTNSIIGGIAVAAVVVGGITALWVRRRASVRR